MRKSTEQFQLWTTAFKPARPQPRVIRGENCDATFFYAIKHQKRFIERAFHNHMP